MTEVLNQLIANYDLSDLLNQAVIALLFVLLVVQANIKVRFRRYSPYC